MFKMKWKKSQTSSGYYLKSKNKYLRLEVYKGTKLKYSLHIINMLNFKGRKIGEYKTLKEARKEAKEYIKKYQS